jgi:hypothetical protein
MVRIIGGCAYHKLLTTLRWLGGGLQMFLTKFAKSKYRVLRGQQADAEKVVRIFKRTLSPK